MKRFTRYSDSNSLVADIIPVSEDIYSGQLSENIPVDIAVPSGAKYAFFSANGSFYFKEGAGASIPNSFGRHDSELNPAARRIDSDVISVVSQYDTHLTILFYK